MLDNYEKDRNGVIKQINKESFTYNNDYVETRYNRYDTAEAMSYLRFGYLLGVVAPFAPKKILDIGYGNGDFLIAARNGVESCFGSDIQPAYPLPDDVSFVNDIYEDSYDVVCFFDSLEHFEDIYEIASLKTEYIYISVPQCHYVSDEWFEAWKHRRVDEHLWHFNLRSLNSFFEDIGYKYISHSNVEDAIRKPEGELPNILTAVYKKIHK